MKALYDLICGFFKRKRRMTPAEIAASLPKDALAALQREAGFLRGQGVDASELAKGEVPHAPRAVDAEVEKKLTSPPVPQAFP